MWAVMTAPNLRVGLIGAGFIARVHAKAIRTSGAQLVAVAAGSPVTASALAASSGARVADDAASILAADDIDVVHICSPNGTHVGFAAAAIAAGKHVVCEKPLATAGDDAAHLAHLAREADLIAAVPFAYRYLPMVHELRARVLSGGAGPLVTVAGEYLQDWRLSSPAAGRWADPTVTGPSRAFGDIGSHVGDLIEFTTGHRISSVFAVTRRIADSASDGRPVLTEDLALVTVRLDDGTIGTIAVSQASLGRKNGLVLRIDGTSASYEFHQERPDTLWIGGADHNTVVTRQADRLTPDAANLSVVPAGHPMGYQDAFDGFVADVYRRIHGLPAFGVLPTFDDGARMARLTDAVLRSAAAGAWVDVEAKVAA